MSSPLYLDVSKYAYNYPYVIFMYKTDQNSRHLFRNLEADICVTMTWGWEETSCMVRI